MHHRMLFFSICLAYLTLIWRCSTPPLLLSELPLLPGSCNSSPPPPISYFLMGGAAVKSQWCHFRMWESGARWAGFAVSGVPLHGQRCLIRGAERRKMIIATGTNSSSDALCPNPPAQISGYGALIYLDPKINLYHHHAKGQKSRRVAFLGQVTLTTCPKGKLDGHCAKVPLQYVQRGPDALDATGSYCTVDFSLGNRFILSDSEQD